MLKKLVLVLSCACAMNTCLANNIADNIEAAVAYNCLYDAQGRVIYASDRNKAYECRRCLDGLSGDQSDNR